MILALSDQPKRCIKSAAELFRGELYGFKAIKLVSVKESDY